MSDLSHHLNDTERTILRQALALLLAMREHIDADNRPPESEIDALLTRIEEPHEDDDLGLDHPDVVIAQSGRVTATQSFVDEHGTSVVNEVAGVVHGNVMQAGRDIIGGVHMENPRR